MGFLSKIFGLVTGNPYVALAGFLALASAAGGAWYYVHDLHSQIVDQTTRADNALKDVGTLTSQKTLLLSESADKDIQLEKFKAATAASQAAADAARVEKDALADTLEKVLTDAHNFPPAADGPVADVLGNALIGLCRSRPPGAASPGCGGADEGRIRPH